MDHTGQLTRRSLLAGTAAAALPLSAREANLFERLKAFRFMGEDGRPVDIEALRKRFAGKHVTLSFGFSDCSGFCKFINPTLAALGEHNADKIASIAIDVAPETDGFIPGQRGLYAARLRESGLQDAHDLVVLYPLRPDTPAEMAPEQLPAYLSNEQAPKIARAFDTPGRQDSPRDHTARVFLFAPDGMLKAQKLGTIDHPPEEFVRDWVPLLATPARGR